MASDDIDPGDVQEMIAGVMNSDSLFLLRQALESHVYWQLSDPVYRKDGYVLAPGADDEEIAAQIRDCCELDEQISTVVDYKGRTDLAALLTTLRETDRANWQSRSAGIPVNTDDQDTVKARAAIDGMFAAAKNATPPKPKKATR